MKDLWFEAYEDACGEADGEPSDEAILTAYQERIERLHDAADFARKVERECPDCGSFMNEDEECVRDLAERGDDQ